MDNKTKKKINPLSRFKRMNKERQIEFMREWFGERYEDPAQHTPHDSGEGGYIWIYGGPFDAEEVLRDEFEEYAKEGTIEELADELSNECWEWTRTTSYDRELFPPDEEDYAYEFDGTLEGYAIIIRLQSGLSSLENLLEHGTSLRAPEKTFNHMMTFSFCITYLESYLSDVFASILLKKVDMKKKYLKNDKVLSAEKVALGELFEKYEGIDSTIKRRLSETSFHNLPIVKSMFHAVLGINLGDIAELKAFVEKRHDFVHRGGKDRDGKLVKTSTDEIRQLIEKIRKFCSDINTDLESKKLIEPSPF